MTPEEFNALPLTEQCKALQAGDKMHLRGGGWLPFVRYYADGIMTAETRYSVIPLHDIIRVVRPTERKVPEVQSCDMADADWLRYMADKFVRDEPICERLLFIADKYEQMVFANIPKFLHPKTQRNVPEVVGILREKITETINIKNNDVAIVHILAALAYIADHFEKG